MLAGLGRLGSMRDPDTARRTVAELRGCQAVGATRRAGGHPDLPAGGYEEDPMAITERDRIR
jgi:hypothetical protein